MKDHIQVLKIYIVPWLPSQAYASSPDMSGLKAEKEALRAAGLSSDSAMELQIKAVINTFASFSRILTALVLLFPLNPFC